MDSVLSTALGLSSVDVGRIIGGIADWVTIGAFVITLVGLLSAFLARGKLRIGVYGEPNSSSFSLTLSDTGSNPVQQIAYHRAWITRTGKPLAGDGTVPLVQALYPGESYYVHIFDAEVHEWSGEVRSNEARWGSSRRSDGAVVVLTWRNFLVPWMRRRRVLILMFGHPVTQITGRRARAVVRDMTSMGPGSTPGAIRAELAKANGGVLPAEQPYKIGTLARSRSSDPRSSLRAMARAGPALSWCRPARRWAPGGARVPGAS